MARAIMIQGTASNAGKSFITAGFCRVFAQDGYRVAPFKSQNMALNSYITREGLEMGRAQVVQAEAAGIEPTVDMNPILLKPMRDNLSQVILRGEVQGDMNARDYYEYANRAIPAIRESYGRLDAEYDIIVIEGAGSPAEINLKEHDLVNMYIAKMAGAPVLLAADIDRGGVFASIIGTHMLFDEEERKHFKGVLINKFRGDATLLTPGLDMLYDRIGVPTLGVIPYTRIDIDDEDSLSERMRAGGGEEALIDIAVLYLPHISNFTDLTAFGRFPGVSVRYITKAGELGNPDLIVIPGTKNTMYDLSAIRSNGLEAAVIRKAQSGTPVIGICGGYQMLGQVLSDPLTVESGGEMQGMGLLPIRTVFEKAKIRTRMTGSFLNISGILSPLSDTPVSGYEIHMGRSEPVDGTAASALKPLLRLQGEDEKESYEDGAVSGNIMGTYLHGLFDETEAGVRLLEALCAAKGIPAPEADVQSYDSYKEAQYDLLADLIREHVDMDHVYRLLEEGV